MILRQLRTASSPVEFSTLVDAVLDAGDGDGDGDGDDRTRQRVAIALDHRHLPKLAAQDFVAYDRDRGRVTYTAGSRAERLLDALSRLE